PWERPERERHEDEEEERRLAEERADRALARRDEREPCDDHDGGDVLHRGPAERELRVAAVELPAVREDLAEDRAGGVRDDSPERVGRDGAPSERASDEVARPDHQRHLRETAEDCDTARAQ